MFRTDFLRLPLISAEGAVPAPATSAPGDAEGGEAPACVQEGPLFAFWGAFAAITVGSLALRQDGATPDVSWLTAMCERMLDGERGWIDIFETTPPVPTLLYMPGVLISRVSGLGVEAAVFATAYAAAIGSLICTLRLLPARIAGGVSSAWAVVLPAAFFLLVLSNDAFAQREYFAAAFTMPMFAVFVRRVESGAWPPLAGRLAAATLAGLAFAIKPPIFAVPFLAMAGVELARTRSLAFIFPSMLPVAAASGLALTVASLAIFPDYLGGVTTLMRDVYVPLRLSPLHGVNSAYVATASCLGASILLGLRNQKDAATTLAQVLTAAYFAIYFVQGKLFAYHLQPAALFAVVSLSIPLCSSLGRLWAFSGGRKLLAALQGGVALALAMYLLQAFDDRRPQMRDLTWAAALDRPTAMAITPDISVSFPLAAHINARWIDRIHSQWVSRYARVAIGRDNLSASERDRFQAYYDRDIERTRLLIREGRPELIIQCIAPSTLWLTQALLARDPTLLDDYNAIAEEGVIRILRRRDAITAN